MKFQSRPTAPLTVEQLEAELEQHLARLSKYPYSEWDQGAAQYDYRLFLRKQAEWLTATSATKAKGF